MFSFNMRNLRKNISIWNLVTFQKLGRQNCALFRIKNAVCVYNNMSCVSSSNVKWPDEVCGFVGFTQLKLHYIAWQHLTAAPETPSLFSSCWLPIPGLFALLII